jgi:hypothetical protein
MSALPPKADINGRVRDVRLVPIASYRAAAKAHHYSMSSSARPDKGSGTVIPSVLMAAASNHRFKTSVRLQ